MIAHHLLVFSLLQGRPRQTRTAHSDLAISRGRRLEPTQLGCDSRRRPPCSTPGDAVGEDRGESDTGDAAASPSHTPARPPRAPASPATTAAHRAVHTTVIRISIDGANHCALHCSTLDTRSRKFVLTSSMLCVRACILDRSAT